MVVTSTGFYMLLLFILVECQGHSVQKIKWEIFVVVVFITLMFLKTTLPLLPFLRFV